jgi:peptidoglycan/xylan/chitin deacetylase (PgdA/CDA1 family)
MSPPGFAPPDHGALVVSLDFELVWGVRDAMGCDGGPYRENLLGERRAVPRILELFESFGVAATWATVGALFARDRDELERFAPDVRPRYAEPSLDPYGDPIGRDEADDPLRFAPSLVEAIAATPGQELATHTFSHYYCLAPGQDREAFRADLRSALDIAAARGIEIESIVFPRNQHNPDYDDVLVELGLRAYRGCARPRAIQAMRLSEAAEPRLEPLRRRVSPLVGKLDHYLDLSGAGTLAWDAVRQPNGLCNVAASFVLAPYSRRWRAFEPLHLARVAKGIQEAARARRLYHLWWHPHNFGVDLAENLAGLRRLLERFDRLRTTDGLRSLTMADVAGIVAPAGVAP